MATNNAINANESPLGAGSGGTGKATLNAHTTMNGNGTAPVTNLAVGTSGSTIIGHTGSGPAMSQLTSSLSSLTITTGANALGFDVFSWTSTTAWTPALKFGGNSTALTYTTQTGTYRRVGKTVFLTAKMVILTVGSSTGAVTITGLPVSANTVCSLSVSFSNLTYVGQIMTQTANLSTTLTVIVDSGSGASTGLTNAAFAVGTVFIVSGQYTTS